MRIPINLRRAGVILGALLMAGLPTGRLAMPQNNDQAEVLFQAARSKELVSGELEQAIGLYKKIVATYSSNRPLAAKALLQMGECYEKLGKDEARKAYERVLRDYADQSQAAEQARTRLAALRKPALKESDMATRLIWSPPDAGSLMGSPSPDRRPGSS
jgi:tetratricopeptide (TPR) repeat protein